MAESRERTPEEREAARLERERRRRGQPPSSGFPAQAERPATRPAAPVSGTPPPPATEAPAPAPAVDGDGEAGADEHHRESASGTRRVGWRERAAAATIAGTSRPLSKTPPSQRSGLREAGGGRRHSFLVRAGALVALLVAGAVIWFCIEVFQPFHGAGHGSVTVTIPAHAGAHQVGDLLARDGVVSSGFFFYIRAALAGDRGKLIAGTYHLKLGMSYGDALKVLSTPPPAAKVTNVTVIPGETRAQLSARLHAEGISGNYQAATRHSPLLNPVAYGAPRSTPSLEGFLFPNTYELREPISLGALITDQLTTFKQQFGRLDLSYARSRHLTPYDVLIIASIVEKESATRHDDPLVASVIYNRLEKGIPLGMDSTTRYEFNDYTKPLTSSQLAARSPYNTRVNRGLPPTPISNPGLAAIEAAARPAVTNYLYFVVKPCGNGASVFTSSYRQFQADSARYQQARAANGGNSPTKC